MSATPNSSVPDNARPEDKEEDDKKREENLEAAMAVLNMELCQKLQGVDPTQQTEADDLLSYVLLIFWSYWTLSETIGGGSHTTDRGRWSIVVRIVDILFWSQWTLVRKRIVHYNKMYNRLSCRMLWYIMNSNYMSIWSLYECFLLIVTWLEWMFKGLFCFFSVCLFVYLFVCLSLDNH